MRGFVEVCEMEAQDMRRVFGMIAVAVMLVGSGVASAQMIDPSTGVTVDPTTDPMDFSAVASGQPGNIGMELAAQAAAQAQQQAQEAEEQAEQDAEQAQAMVEQQAALAASSDGSINPAAMPMMVTTPQF